MQIAVCVNRHGFIAFHQLKHRLGRFAGGKAAALAAGLAADTPAVAMMSATCPDERHLAATISTLPERLAELPDTGPVLVMIGHVFGPRLDATVLSRASHG